MKLSTIVPVFNREDTVEMTIRSLLEQTVPPDELLVVDDGSTDRTADIVRAFGEPVRLIQQSNAGPSAARNTGWRESRGEFIEFFDSDDLALPRKHELQLARLEETDSDIVVGPWVKGQLCGANFVPETQVYQRAGLPSGDLIEALLSRWSLVPQTCLFRKSIVDEVQGFPVSLRYGEDQLFLLRCLLKRARVTSVQSGLVLYRTDVAGSLSEHPGRFKDWARFLLQATAECRMLEIDPVRWPGFRMRVWAALTDLQEEDELKALLGELLHDYSLTNLPFRRWLSGKVAGARFRLLGHREPRDFRMGPMTAEEQTEIERYLGRVSQ